MPDQDKIRAAFERKAEILARRPAIGQGTAVTKIRIREGMVCDVEEGPWKLTVDLGEASGGTNTAPNPGVYGRAALGSCLAMSYVMWAAKLDVPISHLEVEVQADYDAGSHYGVSDAPPGYQEVRYLVTVESPASEADLLHLLDKADAHTPYLDVFGRAQPMRREVRHLASVG
ncbi:MAG TPA: OsmC family protein [Rhodothermales bacterium]|nr:OsmC family protein [Rhodothermales bacterium]